jgi:hypothetical protein
MPAPVVLFHDAMNSHLFLLFPLVFWLSSAQAAEEKGILEVLPSLAELGQDWTTNLVTYLFDPCSRPSEIAFSEDPETSPFLDWLRTGIQTNSPAGHGLSGRTGDCLAHYGCGDLIFGSGEVQLCVMRWSDAHLLGNHWQEWKTKMSPSRVFRAEGLVGEDSCWSEDLTEQKLAFRRGLFTVTATAGTCSDCSAMLRLAQAVDAKIHGKPTSKSEDSEADKRSHGVEPAKKDSAKAVEERPILEIAPTLAELGPEWTTNQIAYLLDARSHPSEVDLYDRTPSPVLEFHRAQMKKDGRTGYATIHYGRGNLVMNRGLYRVYIQRWSDKWTLQNRWIEWKMYPTRIVRPAPPLGEDCYWRDDGSFQDFVFRRGLFHVIVEAGSDSDYLPMIRLAEVINAKIAGRRLPLAHAEPKVGGTDEQIGRPSN